MCCVSLSSDAVCLHLVVNPVSCMGPAKQPSLYSTPAPGHLFTQTKPEATPSNGDSWKFFSSVTVQPSAASAQSVTQDFRTVNLSDLHDFAFSNFPPPAQSDSGSRRDGARANGTGNIVAQEGQNAFASSMGLMDENEIPEFPSFSEAQTSDVENINTDDFQAMLGQSGLPGDGTSATSACHANTAGTMGSSGVEQVPRNLANGTWMTFPPSIVNLLQSEQMTDTGLPSTPIASVALDDMDMLNSIDEDRLMSILNSGNSFMSGHPT